MSINTEPQIDYNAVTEFMNQQVAKLVADWWEILHAYPYTDVYLYWRPGEVKVATQLPEGFELASVDKLSGFMDKAKCAVKIREILRSLPFLPIEQFYKKDKKAKVAKHARRRRE